MEGTFEEMVQGTILFIATVSVRELAEFIVHQTNSIEGLMKNNQTFVEAFRKMYPNAKSAEIESRPQHSPQTGPEKKACSETD